MSKRFHEKIGDCEQSTGRVSGAGTRDDPLRTFAWEVEATYERALVSDHMVKE